MSYVPDLDLFAAAGTPDWIHVRRPAHDTGQMQEYRVRVIEQPTRHVEVEMRGDSGWVPVRYHIRVREIAGLAGVRV